MTCGAKTKMSNPLCPDCGKVTKIVVYGLPMEEPTENDDWVIGGCTIEEPFDNGYLCLDCDNYFRAQPNYLVSDTDGK